MKRLKVLRVSTPVVRFTLSTDQLRRLSGGMVVRVDVPAGEHTPDFTLLLRGPVPQDETVTASELAPECVVVSGSPHRGPVDRVLVTRLHGRLIDVKGGVCQGHRHDALRTVQLSVIDAAVALEPLDGEI